MPELNVYVYVVPVGMLLCSLVVSWCTYPCNAYGNVKWNMTTKSEQRPKYLAKYRDPYQAKCTENCDIYKKQLTLIFINANFDEIKAGGKGAYPNPFCYNWDLQNRNPEDSSNYHKFKSKVIRSVDGNWKNKMSVLLSLVTIILLSIQTAMNADQTATDIWFAVGLITTIMSHLGTLYFGIEAFSYLSCLERNANYDWYSGKFQGFNFLRYCHQKVSEHHAPLDDVQRHSVDLPEIPLEWAIYKWNLAFQYVATIPVVASGIYNVWWRRANRNRILLKQ